MTYLTNWLEDEVSTAAWGQTKPSSRSHQINKMIPSISYPQLSCRDSSDMEKVLWSVEFKFHILSVLKYGGNYLSWNFTRYILFPIATSPVSCAFSKQRMLLLAILNHPKLLFWMEPLCSMLLCIRKGRPSDTERPHRSSFHNLIRPECCRLVNFTFSYEPSCLALLHSINLQICK